MASKMSKRTWLIVAILIIVVGTIVGIVISCNSSNPSDLTLSIIAWNETGLYAFEGTPVVLNFWSISCYWCRQQLPYLENVAQQNEGGIKVIAINVADNTENIQKFFGDYEPAMIIAVDENRETFADYCVAYNNTRGSIPFTFFIDSEGLVQYVKIGAFASETELWNTLHDIFGTTIP
jgi:thiol-disulfide isomerase/thioredoxin